MEFSFTSTLGIDRPAADVWAALIDFPNVPKWERGPVEVRQVSPGPPGVGTRLVARRIFAGRDYAVEPDGPVRSVVTFRGEGTLRMPMFVAHATDPPHRTGGGPAKPPAAQAHA